MKDFQEAFSKIVLATGGVATALLVIFGIILLAIAFQGGILYLVWNYLVVAFFDAQAITYIQACIAALVLSIVGDYFKSRSK